MAGDRRLGRLAPAVRRAAVLLGLAAGLAPGGAAPAAATGRQVGGATFFAAPSATGTSCSSGDPCPLARALAAAGGGGEVELAAGAYVVSEPLGLRPSAPLAVVGAAGGSRLVGAEVVGPLLQLSGSSQVTLQGLTLSGAVEGAVEDEGGALDVADSTFVGDGEDRAGGGGAIDYDPTVAGAELTAEGDTFFDDAGTEAGAVEVAAGSAAIEGSTFAEDRSPGGPGAVGGSGAFLQADLLAADGATACSAGVRLAAGVVAVGSTCAGAVEAPEGAVFSGGGPVLAPSGGPVETVAIRAGAADPAAGAVGSGVAGIVASSNAFCSLEDARGVARLIGAATSCAAGAAEPDPPTVISVSPGGGGDGTAVTISGSGLALTTAVSLETVPLSFRVDGDTSLSFTVPTGLYDADAPLVVTGPDGQAVATFVATGALAVATPSLPASETGAPYDVVLVADGGGGGNRWSATGLPPGLALAADGLLSGRPRAPSTSSVTVRVSDRSGDTASATLALAVGSGPSVLTTSLPPAEVGLAYAAPLEASGGEPPYRWSVVPRSPMPGGLLLTSSGRLAGIPATAATSTVELEVTDAAGGSATATLTLEVEEPPQAYAVVARRGVLESYGASASDHRLPAGLAPFVAAAADPKGGWWVLAADGRVVGAGGARSLGGVAAGPGAAYPVGIAADPDGSGYWVVDAGGEVAGFGGATALPPATGATSAGAPSSGRVVAIAADPAGGGYWLVDDSGGVEPFGDARSFGSVGRRLRVHAVALAAMRSGRGYLVLTAAGRVYAFGSAAVLGDLAHHVGARYVGIAVAPIGVGYLLAAADGVVTAFGSARLPEEQPPVGGAVAIVAGGPAR